MTNSQNFAIAIDGPVGVGKSTTAKLVAQMLKINYIDTGAMYRTVALYGIQNGIDLSNPTALENSLQNIKIDLFHIDGVQRVNLNGTDVTDLLRTQAISDATSRLVAINPVVREKLIEKQRQIAKTSAVVMDGRDIGSYVLPNAEVKIYLDAAPEVRARRRTLEMEAKGQPADFDQILQETIERDERDKNRPIAPLVHMPDAICIDTAEMAPEDVAKKIIAYVH